MVGRLPAKVWLLAGGTRRGDRPRGTGCVTRRSEALVFMFQNISSHNIHTHSRAHPLRTVRLYTHPRPSPAPVCAPLPSQDNPAGHHSFPRYLCAPRPLGVQRPGRGAACHGCPQPAPTGSGPLFLGQVAGKLGASEQSLSLAGLGTAGSQGGWGLAHQSQVLGQKHFSGGLS